MPKQLRLEEMIDAARLASPGPSALRALADISARQLEAIGSTLAEALAEHLGVDCGDTTCEEEAFAGCCTPFYARHVGQPCPEPLRDFDPREWTLSDGTELYEATGEPVTEG